MKAVVTTGCGGYDKLDYCDVPVPEPARDEVLLQVLAAGVNNTEINTRLGWYSAKVSGATAETALSAAASFAERSDGGWNAPTPFPFIQGTDCCGRVIAIGAGVDRRLMEARVLVRSCMRTQGFASMETRWLGSDFDGAFAQFVTVPAAEVFPVHCNWSDVQLGSIPCAYGTAENMLHRSRLAPGERVLISGASGGVGSAAVQLAKRRGAHVTAMAGAAKQLQVRAIGADAVLDRDIDLLASAGANAFDLVVDNVVGANFPAMLQVLRRGGRYVTSGAIAGPIVTLDIREMYLKDILLVGCTAWDEPVFSNLVAYIERGEIRPLVAQTLPLEKIVDAQRIFLEKKHVGKIVLIPPTS